MYQMQNKIIKNGSQVAVISRDRKQFEIKAKNCLTLESNILLNVLTVIVT